MNRINAETLLGWITDRQELALLDAREDGAFGASHLFWAVPCGLARKEIRARALLPRLSVRVCCVDDGSGLAETLAGWLESIGCTDVSVLGGGTKAWEAAGNVLYSGVNVPSKAFGEWVEHHYGTESVDAPELKAWIEFRPQHGGAGQPDGRRVRPYVDPDRHQRAGRRAGVPHRGYRA